MRFILARLDGSKRQPKFKKLLKARIQFGPFLNLLFPFGHVLEVFVHFKFFQPTLLLKPKFEINSDLLTSDLSVTYIRYECSHSGTGSPESLLCWVFSARDFLPFLFILGILLFRFIPVILRISPFFISGTFPVFFVPDDQTGLKLKLCHKFSFENTHERPNSALLQTSPQLQFHPFF